MNPPLTIAFWAGGERQRAGFERSIAGDAEGDARVLGKRLRLVREFGRARGLARVIRKNRGDLDQGDLRRVTDADREAPDSRLAIGDKILLRLAQVRQGLEKGLVGRKEHDGAHGVSGRLCGEPKLVHRAAIGRGPHFELPAEEHLRAARRHFDLQLAVRRMIPARVQKTWNHRLKHVAPEPNQA